ncbi:MAG: sterol desaturase family protein [Colwelliaceae bacterium]|nr:sterol desaturase family protein [Colwelliaceae bacterium]
MLKTGKFKVGHGQLSGYIACFLGLLSFLAVLAFHFPEYLTTPELRDSYNVTVLRVILFISLIISGSLALLNFIRNRNKRLGGVAWLFVTLSILLGGHNIEVEYFPSNTPYLGLDWFILDLLGSTIIFVFIEKLFTYKKTQPVLRHDWQLDLQYFGLNHLIIGFVLLVSNTIAQSTLLWLKVDMLQQAITNLPFIAQVFLIILVADLIQYAVHRCCHQIPFLWRFHVIHHSVERMDWLAGSRLHIVDVLLTRSMVLIPVFIFGFSKEVIDIYVIFAGFQAVLNHANVQLNFSIFRHFLVTPQFHHWHHASDEEGIDRNYAAHFSFIDKLFGSEVKTDKEWPMQYGLVRQKLPKSLLKQFIYPFNKLQ